MSTTTEYTYYGIAGNPDGKRVDVLGVERGARKRQTVVATLPTQKEALADMERRNRPIFIARAIPQMVACGMTEAEAHAKAHEIHGA